MIIAGWIRENKEHMQKKTKNNARRGIKKGEKINEKAEKMFENMFHCKNGWIDNHIMTRPWGG